MSRRDGVLLGYLPFAGECEIESIGAAAVTTYSFTPRLRQLTRAEPGKFRPLIGCVVRVHFHPELPELVDRIEPVGD